VKKVYNSSVKAWFGDLQDGKHDGSENDPRVAVMIVKPYEVSGVFFLAAWVLGRILGSLRDS
jgi:hypothetical protein